MTPTISVILPTYNRAYCLKDSIDSVLSQSFSDIELIIVDDCSTDDTYNVISSYSDKRIHYLVNPQNKGAAFSRNVGIDAARGDFIALQDSDDTWDLSKLSKQLDFLNQHSDFGMAYTKMRCRYSDPTKKDTFIPNNLIADSDLSGDIYRPLLIHNYIGAPTILARKDIIKKCGYFDDSMKCLEDWDYILKIAKNTFIGYIDEPLHIYNINPGESVSGHIENHFEAYCRIIHKNKAALIEYNILNTVLENILNQASECGVLEPVGKLLEISLTVP